MLVLTLGLLSVATGVTTLWRAITRSANPDDPDASFWYAFTGACIYLPLLLITTTISPWVGAAILLATVAVALPTSKNAVQIRVRQRAEQEAHALAMGQRALTDRHETILRRWSNYALDPAACIDFPQMHDVRIPEISALTQALSQAEYLRHTQVPAAEGLIPRTYNEAVSSLEDAFVRAERKITGE